MNNSIIKKWENKYDKILFITGNPGTGKTHLLNNIIKNYESICINDITNNTYQYIKNVFETINITSMVMKTKKNKIIYIDDNTNCNIKFFKELETLNKPIIITITNPISKKFYTYIMKQYHIELVINKTNIIDILKAKNINNISIINNNLTSCITNSTTITTSSQDIFNYNIINVINNIINKKYKLEELHCLCEEKIIILHLLENIIDQELTELLYDSFCNYNRLIYNSIYYQIYYLIIPVIIMNNANKKYINIKKYTKNISNLIIYKSNQNKLSYICEDNYINFIDKISLL